MKTATTTKTAIALICCFAFATAFTTPIRETCASPTPADTVVPRKKPIPKSYYNDRNEYRVGDINLALKELDRAMVELNNNLKIELPDIEREIKAALAEVNKVDFDLVNREVKASLDKIDWKQIKTEINDALRDVKVELNEADKKEIKEAMEKARKEIKEKLADKDDMDGLNNSLHKSLDKARTGIEKAKKDLGQLKELTDQLEKDKLIDKKKGYKIQMKGADMYINGVKQSTEVSNKYRKYFKEKDYSIVSDGDEISSI